MASSASRVFGLFDFNEGDPGIGTLTSIYLPSVPENHEDCGILCAAWMKSAKDLVIRLYFFPHYQ